MSSNHASPSHSLKAPSSAFSMPLHERKRLAVEAMVGTSCIARLAASANTSRKFIYAQKQKAEIALNEAFSPSANTKEQVLFYLPVTKSWITRFVLALILICHSSFRNVIEILRDLFGFNISIGTVHNIVEQAVETARQQNLREDLSSIKVGAHDEIFQGRAPVLVGCDAHSTYCYLLSAEETRDADTWGSALLDAEKRGLKPDYTVGDGGQGLRAGQALAWPDILCHADVFHAVHDLGKTVIYLENRAYGALAIKDEIEKRMAKARKRDQGTKLSRKLGYACVKCDQAVALFDAVDILLEWLRNDILGLIGSDLHTREVLFDFIVDELKAREGQAPHRIGPIRRKLENQKSDLLRFAHLIDQKLALIAREYAVNESDVRKVFLLENSELSPSQRAIIEKQARSVLRHRFYGIQTALEEMIGEVVRASSVIENLNSRLRNYFFLRKQIGSSYLDLLRFFLNHRRFMRSEHPDRVGKSPRELMTEETHSHWLDLLGLPSCRLAA